MKAIRIKQLDKLEKALQLDGYETDAKIRRSHNLLLIIIKLKEGDIPQIAESWETARIAE